MLARTIPHIEEHFGGYLSDMKWINLGGGHHITKEGYDIGLLCRTVDSLQQKYGGERPQLVLAAETAHREELDGAAAHLADDVDGRVGRNERRRLGVLGNGACRDLHEAGYARRRTHRIDVALVISNVRAGRADLAERLVEVVRLDALRDLGDHVALLGVAATQAYREVAIENLQSSDYANLSALVFPSKAPAHRPGYRYLCTIRFTVGGEEYEFTDLPVHDRRSADIQAVSRNQHLMIETRIGKKIEDKFLVSFHFEVNDWVYEEPSFVWFH